MGLITTPKIKIFLLGLFMMMVLFCLSSQVYAEQEGDYTYSITNGQAQITGYTGVGGDIVIPDNLGGYPVTSIGYFAFSYYFGFNKAIITSVTIPNGVTSIGDHAFDDCRSLYNIYLPDGLTSIGSFAFNQCMGLNNVIFKKGITSIATGAFNNCWNLTNVSIPLGVTSIGNNAFRCCYGLSSINLPEGVTEIGSEAFCFSGLKTISLPQTLKNIGEKAFAYSGLTTISLPQGVISIDVDSFSNCNSLNSINFYSPTTVIYSASYWGAHTIPPSTTIYGYSPSTAENYATNNGRTFVNMGASNLSGDTINSITNMIKNGDHKLNNTQGVPIQEPIDSATGAHSLHTDLLTVHGARDINFSTQYYSLLTQPGSLGNGWSHNYETFLDIKTDNNIEVHWNANQCNQFTAIGDNTYFTNEISVQNDNLIKNLDNTYTLTCPDQSVYRFDSTGKLSEQVNSHGQKLNFTYNANNKLQRILEPISGRILNFQYNVDGYLDNVQDNTNRLVSFTYDSSHNLTGITNALGKTTTYRYDINGYVLSAVDSEGTSMFTNIYDIYGRVIAQQDAVSTHHQGTFIYDEVSEVGKVKTTYKNREGESSKFIYDNNYKLISYTDELDCTTTYTYDASGNKTSKTDVNGNKTAYTYDILGNLLTVANAEGDITLMTYDKNNNLLSVQDATGNKTVYTYDSNNNLLSTTDPMGNLTSYTYDNNGLMLAKITPSGTTSYTYKNGMVKTITDPTGVVVNNDYDDAGRLINKTDVNGNKTTMEYDAMDNLIKITDPLGNFKTCTYDDHGYKITETDARGNTTRYVYNGNGKMIRKTDALGNITQYEYDGEDRLIRIIDPIGNVTAYTYDAKGNKVSTTNPYGDTYIEVYDTVGNITNQIDALGNSKKTIIYDKLNNPLMVSDALDNNITYQYDENSRLVSSTDPSGKITEYTYDDLNRLISCTDTLKQTTSQSFDQSNNKLDITDQNNNKVTYTYDAAGRILSRMSASGSKESFVYNNRGLLVQYSDARGQLRTYDYDANGRVVSVSDPDGMISYTYDANGNLTCITDTMGSVSYQYNEVNQKTSYTDINGNVIKYSYDANGNLTELIYPDGKIVNYQYNAANQLQRVTDWNERITSYTYDSNGRLSTTRRPDGSVENRTYDSKGQLLELIDLNQEGSIINDYKYLYDAKGNVISEMNSLVKNQEDLLIASDIALTYDENNSLTTFDGQEVKKDSNGNTIFGPLNSTMDSFTYDSRNRLTKAGGTTYTYDAEDKRISINDSGNLIHDTFITNPQSTLNQILVKTDYLNNTVYYVYGLGLLGQQDQNGNYFTYHYDRRGSTTVLTDSTGNCTDTFQYGPYGEMNSHTGNTYTPFLYNGRDGVMTDHNKLYYMRARYYNPEIKRFINQDVIQGSIDNGQSLNRYAYVNGKPISDIDPFGLSPVDSAIEKIQTIRPFTDLTLDIAVKLNEADDSGLLSPFIPFYNNAKKVLKVISIGESVITVKDAMDNKSNGELFRELATPQEKQEIEEIWLPVMAPSQTLETLSDEQLWEFAQRVHGATWNKIYMKNATNVVEEGVGWWSSYIL